MNHHSYHTKEIKRFLTEIIAAETTGECYKPDYSEWLYQTAARLLTNWPDPNQQNLLNQNQPVQPDKPGPSDNHKHPPVPAPKNL